MLKRSGHRCALCGRPSGLEIAHIVALAEGGDSSADNLIVLCRSCHFELDRNPTISLEELERSRSAGYRLERVTAEKFHQRGFAVLTGATGSDAGTDLAVRRRDPSADTSTLYIVQCKSSRRPIGAQQIAGFSIKAQQYGAAQGILVTDAPLTPAALDAAKLQAVHVVSVEELDDLIDSLETESDG